MPLLNSTYKINGKVNFEIPAEKRMPTPLVEEIIKALHSISGYGSVEIYVQDHSVTQITVRNIKKTRHNLAE